ncbi:UDP-Glycosyltransferase superfamily protein isoform 1 [Theobroma cacao]|uniref:Alpha-1,3/1,6-mannosyltransferase ALG2 n=1 Tax=Theobroma cacao TaxID=3641 RepID=A0A061FFS2_THECC|nr:UDP-Glycosyltransferase superfamily protein isoform 1 [Theobroma cacao]
MERKQSSKLNIAFIHPDLGIGGAERLIVDAAVELASHGHSVHIFTAHHDKNRCFEETRAGIFPVTVYGDFLPRHIFYRLHAVCAYLRCMFVALCVLFMWPSYDVIVADLVSVVIPLVKLKKSTKVVFYCHFPDLLLARHTTFLRRMYRKPIDFIEELTTGMADMILVNSRFTASIFAKTFKHLHARGIRPAVLHPAVNVDQFEKPHSYKLNFLSINRFERKKNIDLAVSAFAMLHTLEGNIHQTSNLADANLTIAASNTVVLQCQYKQVRKSVTGRTLVIIVGCTPGIPLKRIIVIQGFHLTSQHVLCGYDRRLRENVEYLEELKSLAEREGVADRVNFVTSCSTAERNSLLSQCLCVLYTPTDEHFGIVPLEAMAAQKPVIACNSGGPVETIKNGETGFLCDPTPKDFALAMAKLIQDPEMAKRLGEQARQHVNESFSTRIFGQRLNQFLLDVAGNKQD